MCKRGRHGGCSGCRCDPGAASNRPYDLAARRGLYLVGTAPTTLGGAPGPPRLASARLRPEPRGPDLGPGQGSVPGDGELSTPDTRPVVPPPGAGPRAGRTPEATRPE